MSAQGGHVICWTRTLTTSGPSSNSGATALHLASKKSGREMCRKLLAAGADASLTDADGNIPEQVACCLCLSLASSLSVSLSLSPSLTRSLSPSLSDLIRATCMRRLRLLAID